LHGHSRRPPLPPAIGAWPALALALAVLACQADSRPAPKASVSTSGSTPIDNRTTDVVRYHGAGFDIELPPGSTIARGDRADTLRGPAVVEAGRTAEMGGPGPHPTFLLEVSMIPNPARVALDAWADSARREAGKAADEIAAPGSLVSDTIGVAPAVSFEPFCGDCASRVSYIASGDRIVTLRYDKGIHLAGTREQQENAYRGVLATFRWSQPEGNDTTGARDAVLRRYEAHFHGGQGFSADTLRARRSWFTPDLYRLMAADLNTAGDIGYLDFDPFTDAQDDATRFDVGAVRTSHDTVYVEVNVHFGTDVRRLTLAMQATPDGWAIADFIYPDGDLAANLRKAANTAGR